MKDKEVRRFEASLETPDIGPQVIEFGWRYVSGPRVSTVGDFMVEGRVVLPSDFPELSEEEFERCRSLLAEVCRQLLGTTCLRVLW